MTAAEVTETAALVEREDAAADALVERDDSATAADEAAMEAAEDATLSTEEITLAEASDAEESTLPKKRKERLGQPEVLGKNRANKAPTSQSHCSLHTR